MILVDKWTCKSGIHQKFICYRNKMSSYLKSENIISALSLCVSENVNWMYKQFKTLV